MLHYFHPTLSAELRTKFEERSRDGNPPQNRPGARILWHFNTVVERSAAAGENLSANTRGALLEACVYDALRFYDVDDANIRKNVQYGHRAKADLLVSTPNGSIAIFTLVSLRERWMMVDRNALILNDSPQFQVRDATYPRSRAVFVSERTNDDADQCINAAVRVNRDLYAERTLVASLHDEHAISNLFEECGANLHRT